MHSRNPEHIRIREEIREEMRAARWREQLLFDRLRELESIENATEQALWRRVREFDLEFELTLKVAIEPDGRIHTAVRRARDELAELDDRIWKYGRDGGGCAEEICQDAERAVIELRQITRELGATL